MQFGLFSTQILTSVLLVLLSAATGTEAANYFYGIAAANSKPNSGYSCRSAADWNNLAANARDSGFQSIRVIGFDCDALELASAAAAAHGLTVLAGIWFPGTVAQSMVNINNEVQWFRAAVGKYGAGRYRGLTIGNEVNDDPGLIAAKVADVRGYLGSIGINVPVSTVHTWVAIRDNPQAFCIGDFVGANAHAFFDQNTVSNQAGNFLWNTVIPTLRNRCPGKPIVITESGWPSRGGNLGRAVASPADQKAALVSLNCNAARNDRNVQIYAFEADDQTWKGNDNERSFGIFGKVNMANEVNNKC